MAIKELRSKILKKAYQMIVDDDLKNFSVKKLSKKLNISHNAMYRHFKSKWELIYTLLENEFENLAEANRVVIERDDLSNIDKYKECMFCSLEFAVSNSYIYKLMFATEFKNEDVPESFVRAYEKFYNQLLRLIDDCIKAGEIKKKTKYSILNTTWAMLHGIAMLLIDNILPPAKDMDAVPNLPDTNKTDTNHIERYSNIRDTVGFSVDVILHSIFSA